MKKTVSFLITGAGTATAISVIKGLRQQNDFRAKIYTCDMSEDVAGKYFSDIFFKVPAAKDSDYLNTLLGIVNKSKPDLLIPIVDYEFEKISRNKDRFLKLGCTSVISSVETIRKCTNKFNTIKFMNSIGIKTPKSYTKGEIKKKRLKFPLFIKPSIFGRATIDAYKLNSKIDLDYYLDKVKHPIIQEYIEGQEITIDLLNDLGGKFIAAVPRLRLETKGGLSIKGVTIKDKELNKHVKRISEALKIVGPCNIQCFRNKKGEYIFFEVNPRFAGTHAFTIQGGLNSGKILGKLFLGIKIEKSDIKIKDSIRMLRYWDEIFISPSGKVYKPNYRLLINGTSKNN